MQDCTVNFCGRQRLFSSRKGHCSFHDSSRLRMEKREQDKRTAKRRALSAARDELVRAAVALDAAFTDHETPTDARGLWRPLGSWRGPSFAPPSRPSRSWRASR